MNPDIPMTLILCQSKDFGTRAKTKRSDKHIQSYRQSMVPALQVHEKSTPTSQSQQSVCGSHNTAPVSSNPTTKKRTKMTTPPKPRCPLFLPPPYSISIPMLLSLLHPRPAPKVIGLEPSIHNTTHHFPAPARTTESQLTSLLHITHQCPQSPTPPPPGRLSNAASTSITHPQVPQVRKSGPSCPATNLSPESRTRCREIYPRRRTAPMRRRNWIGSIGC